MSVSPEEAERSTNVYISVTDIDRSLGFYSEALKPLGWSMFGSHDAALGSNGGPESYRIGAH